MRFNASRRKNASLRVSYIILTKSDRDIGLNSCKNSEVDPEDDFGLEINNSICNDADSVEQDEFINMNPFNFFLTLIIAFLIW